MSVIIISAGPYSGGQEIAEGLALRLGYRLVGREVLAQAAQEYGQSEAKLVKALDEAPSLFGMSTKQRRVLLSQLEAAVLERLKADGAVTWGLGAHLYLMGVSHVFKVRVLADPGYRARLMTDREKVGQEQAAKAIAEMDQERARWAQALYKADEGDPALYDLVINLGEIDIERAVGMIAETVQAKKFQPMTFSLKLMEDKALAARVRAALAGEHSDVAVQADGGNVVVRAKALKRDKQKKTIAIKDKAQALPGVRYVEVHLINDIFGQAAQGMKQGLR